MKNKRPKNNSSQIGAKVHLTLSFKTNLGSGNIGGSALDIYITNLAKEYRYFNSPIFKLSSPYQNNLDTFQIAESINNISFPKRLGYQEVVRELYPLKSEQKEVFKKVFAKDHNATLKVIINTTCGKKYNSNDYMVKKLIEEFKYSSKSTL